MKQVLILALISTFFFIVSCNKITMNSPATSIEVVAPSLMLTGHCSAWTINFRNSDNHLSKVKNVSLSLTLTSGGSPVAGAKIYSDANCTTENAQINVSGSKTVTVYTNYNLIGGLEMTASAPGFTSSSDVMSTSMDFTRTDLLAGRRELSGNFNGVGADARISEPNGMATDGTYLYVSTFALHSIVRIHIATRTLTHFAGSYSKPGYADGVGSAARFNAPEGLTVLGNDLYVADYQNCVIRKIDLSTRAVTTVAGTAAACTATDGTGAAARFISPVGITNDGTYIYIGDYAAQVIRRLDPVSGAVTTIAGTVVTAGHVDGVGGAA
ncbi:MAG: hypothetical protein ACJ76H_13040, partial [Bacteriovoracaceae bacterium]